MSIGSMPKTAARVLAHAQPISVLYNNLDQTAHVQQENTGDHYSHAFAHLAFCHAAVCSQITSRLVVTWSVLS